MHNTSSPPPIRLIYHPSTMICSRPCQIGPPCSTWQYPNDYHLDMAYSWTYVYLLHVLFLFNNNLIKVLTLRWPRRISCRSRKHIQMWNLQTLFSAYVCYLKIVQHTISQVSSTNKTWSRYLVYDTHRHTHTHTCCQVITGGSN